MKKAIFAVVVATTLFLGGCCMGQPVTEELAENNDEAVHAIVSDNEYLMGVLDDAVAGKENWNVDEDGAPRYDENIRDSMKIRNNQAKNTSKELLDYAKEANKDD